VKAHAGRILTKLALQSRLQVGLAAFALRTADGGRRTADGRDP
jgi:hypothetical protein